VLYIFDLDGTLIRSFIRDAPQKHGSDLEVEVYDKVEVLPNRLAKLRTLAAEGSEFAIASNQAGVAFGFQTVEQVQNKLGLACARLAFFFDRPFSVHVCYHHPKATQTQWKANSIRRKPGAGMLFDAMKAHEASVLSTAFVGDMDTDREAAKGAGLIYYDATRFFGHGAR
jgi:D-glycero-D-manno-heptose 1,7-bisphosphate phosphatase